MTDNFGFLDHGFPSLANLGRQSELYAATDPNASIFKLGLLAEQIVNLIFDFDRIPDADAPNQIDKIRKLYREHYIDGSISNLLHEVRKARNKASHYGWGQTDVAQRFLPPIHSVLWWFIKTYGTGDAQDLSYVPYVPPQPADTQPDVAALEQESPDLLKKDQLYAARSPRVFGDDRKRRSAIVANQRPLTEAETRLIIDLQLKEAGWAADTQNLRYSQGVRPQRGHNIAIAEWPTDSTVGRSGRADYALFAGLELVGIIEAKAAHRDIPAALDSQAKDYAREIRQEDRQYTIGRWGEYQVPFIFATNGRPYLQQYEEKSGIWFQDVRDNVKPPQALQAWPTPEGLKQWFDADPARAQRTLDSFSDDMLVNPSGLNLRDYQVHAIHAVEAAIASGQTSALLAMATGTGKTRTVLGMIYRFLKAKRFNRILFLVDRNALGQQASDAFKDVTLEDLMSLDQLYDVKGLEDVDVSPETKVHVATVQSMIRRVFYAEDDVRPAVSDYDLIIVDEAHRGYLLDKEMSEGEALYRNQMDYQSAYRKLIEYFKAVKVALTATPALHTTQIFGKPVFTYSYRDAVIDGYLVDHDAPHRLTTQLSTSGITFNKGETMPMLDPRTGEITNSAELSDEVTFDVEQFNKQVITEEFNQAVLGEIARDVDPSLPEEFGKTLIYAQDDKHADMIVNILRKIYGAQGIDVNSIMKITGSIGGGNRKKIQQAINRFKNEHFPSVVVTVDLLTTGIDVPPITTLVFLRRVKSRILFEQMLGRATRLCPEIHKDKFDIYDAVGVYQALDQVSTMKPVAVNPNTSFADLIEGLDFADDDDAAKLVIDQVVAKLQRRKQHLSDQVAEQVQDLGGSSLHNIVDTLRQLAPSDAAAWVKDHGELFGYLDAQPIGTGQHPVISHQADRLLTHIRDYGEAQAPGDYLEDFTAFLHDNVNQIAALNIVCTRPSDLTRDQLRSLKLELDRQGFTDIKLSQAVSQMSNQDIAADIISLIRRYAIGSALITHEERVQHAVERLKRKHRFSKPQLGWLNRIRKYLQQELIISRETFDEDARLRQAGGFTRADQAFSGNLGSVLDELNQYLYEEPAQSGDVA